MKESWFFIFRAWIVFSKIFDKLNIKKILHSNSLKNSTCNLKVMLSTYFIWLKQIFRWLWKCLMLMPKDFSHQSLLFSAVKSKTTHLPLTTIRYTIQHSRGSQEQWKQGPSPFLCTTKRLRNLQGNFITTAANFAIKIQSRIREKSNHPYRQKN